MTVSINRDTAYDCTRFDFDGNLCPAGWSQVDTTEDAAHYGIWASPKHLTILSFVEGDITRTHCDTDKEFRAEVEKLVAWHQRMEQWKGIDPGLRAGARDAWHDIGCGEWLHDNPSPVDLYRLEEFIGGSWRLIDKFSDRHIADRELQNITERGMFRVIKSGPKHD